MHLGFCTQRTQEPLFKCRQVWFKKSPKFAPKIATKGKSRIIDFLLLVFFPLHQAPPSRKPAGRRNSGARVAAASQAGGLAKGAAARSLGPGFAGDAGLQLFRARGRTPGRGAAGAGAGRPLFFFGWYYPPARAYPRGTMAVVVWRRCFPWVRLCRCDSDSTLSP